MFFLTQAAWDWTHLIISASCFGICIPLAIPIYYESTYDHPMTTIGMERVNHFSIFLEQIYIFQTIFLVEYNWWIIVNWRLISSYTKVSCPVQTWHIKAQMRFTHKIVMKAIVDSPHFSVNLSYLMEWIFTLPKTGWSETLPVNEVSVVRKVSISIYLLSTYIIYCIKTYLLLMLLTSHISG